MSNTFTLVNPVLVWELSHQEKAILEQHGCIVAAYPNEKYSLGHMVTFPQGTQMEMLTSSQCPIYFPDGYRSRLVWIQNWYHLHPQSHQDGPLL